MHELLRYHKTIFHYHGYVNTAIELLDALRSRGISIVALTGSNRDLFNNLIRNDEFKPHIIDIMDNRIVALEFGNSEFYFVRGSEYHNWNPEKNSGHLLSIGHKQELSFTKPENRKKDYSVLEVGKEIRDKNGLVIAAHPFVGFYVGGLNKEALDMLLDADLLDALEFNGQLPKILEDLFKYNQQTKKYALENDIPVIAAPDAHLLETIDNAYFKLPMDKLDRSSSEGFIKSLKEAIELSRIPRYPGEPNHLYSELNCEGYISMIDFVHWQKLKRGGDMKKSLRLLYIEKN